MMAGTLCLFFPGGPSSERTERDDTHDGGLPGGRMNNDDVPFIMGMPLPDFTFQLGVGSICGFTSGYALKKVGKTVAVGVGLAFIGLQVAQYYGVVKRDAVDWEDMDRRLREALDTDGDGQVTRRDLEVHLRSVIDFLGAELPSGAAFAVAFIAGLRYG